jgi:hypothetical protein
MFYLEEQVEISQPGFLMGREPELIQLCIAGKVSEPVHGPLAVKPATLVFLRVKPPRFFTGK